MGCGSSTHGGGVGGVGGVGVERRAPEAASPNSEGGEVACEDVLRAPLEAADSDSEGGNVAVGDADDTGGLGAPRAHAEDAHAARSLSSGEADFFPTLGVRLAHLHELLASVPAGLATKDVVEQHINP